VKEQVIDDVEEHGLAKRRASLEESRRLEEEWKVVKAVAAATAVTEQVNPASKKVQDKTAKQFEAVTAEPRAAFDITATDASDTALKEAPREEAAQTEGQEAAAAVGAPPVFAGKAAPAVQRWTVKEAKKARKQAADASDTALKEASREDAAQTERQEAAAAVGAPSVFAGKAAPAVQRWTVKEAKKARKQAGIDAALVELGVDDDLLALANPRVVMRVAVEVEKEEEEGHTRARSALPGKQAEEEKTSVRRRKKVDKGTDASARRSTGIKAVPATAGGRKGGGKHRKGEGGVPGGGNSSLTALLFQDGARGHGLATLYVLYSSLLLLLFLGLLFGICRNDIIP
jgi:hypothetical protein